MSQSTPASSHQVIRVNRPATGAIQTLESRPGAELQLDFPEAQTTFARSGNDLTLKVDGGGDVTLTNFFVVGNESLPTLVLADGTKVGAAQFLAAQYPNMDLTTAAGPGGSAPGSGGEGSYADDPGALLGGVDKYGKLGTVFWDRNSEVPDVIHGLDTDGSGRSAGPNTPGTIVPPTPPVPPVAPSISFVTQNLAVHEDGLSWGTHKGDTSHPVSASGVVEIISTEGLGTVTIDGHTVTLPAGWDGSSFSPSGATWNVTDGTLTVTEIHYNNVTDKYEVNFTYKLTTNTLAHSDTADHHDLLSNDNAAAHAAMPNLSVSVTNALGTGSGTEHILVDIYDDGPELGLAHAATGADGNVHLDNSYTTTGTLTPEYGADRAAGSTDDWLDVTFTGTRHIMVNGSPVGTAFNETVHIGFDASGKGSAYTGLGYVEFTKHADNSITYTYQAKRGLKGDSEELTFSVKDGDGDTAKQAYSVEMDQDVPAGTSFVDEAGLTVLGSHHTGFSAATQSFQVFLPEGTTAVNWDLAAINADPVNSIKADANGDGVYSPVTWSLDGSGHLIATAEGKTILTVTQSANPTDDGHGNFTSTFTAELHFPIQHAAPTGGATSDYNIKGLQLGFEATSPDGHGGTMQTSNAVAVAVIDDAPSALQLPVSVVEAVAQAEDVYMVMDVSMSIAEGSLKVGMQALGALVQKYIDLGIESKFTLVTFSSDSITREVQLSAADMKAYIDAGIKAGSADTAAYWREGHTTGTNYDSTLDAVQRLIDASQQDGVTRSYLQKVYFISDGQPNAGMDVQLNAAGNPLTSGGDIGLYGSWKQYIAEHQGSGNGNNQVEVYAVGVGGAVQAGAMAGVTADGAGHSFTISNYNALANQLTGLVQKGTAGGNLLGVDMDNNDTRSADLTLVTSVTFGGATKAITAGGSATFDYDGIKLTVFSDGTYTITSTKSVNADTAYDLKYTLGDADGDSSTANIKLIIKDAKPEAFDNVAGHADADYATGNPILLDDFSSKGHWFDSTSAITYGQTLTGNTFTTIDGTSRLATASDTFVRIDATRATGYGVDMDSELQKITGKTGTELFGGKGQYYEKPDLGGYIEKTIDLFTAGELKFNFLFDRGDTGGTSSLKEHAFAVLLNADGTVAWSGILEPNPDAPSDKTSGLCSIAIDKAGHYTLVIGCYDTLNTASRPSLYVDQVVFTPDMPSNVYHGNMIEDTSPMGLVDTMGDGSHLQSITINGHEYTMVAGGLVLTDVFSTGDKLTVSETGNYSYQTHESHFDNVNIDYTLKENNSSDTGSATLYIRSDEYVHEGNAAGHDIIDLSGQSGSHIIEAHGTDNLITAGNGNDVIYGGTGHDIIHGGGGNDTIHLGDGGSIVYGDGGHDLIYGGAGHDLIYGGSGNDTIYGGAGNDTIYGGTGDDVMYGGSGYDVFAWNKADYDHGTDKVMDFTLREDRMSFADLFGDARQDNISMKDVLHALTSDRLELTASDQNNLVITINDTLGHTEQTVQVHLEGSGMDAATLQGIMNDDAASKAALLQQMLTNLGG